MTIQRKVYSASDAQPIVLHAKQNANDEVAYPVLVDANGSLIISGLVPFAYDSIVISYSSNLISNVYYFLTSNLVSTLTLGYSGSNIISVVRS